MIYQKNLLRTITQLKSKDFSNLFRGAILKLRRQSSRNRVHPPSLLCRIQALVVFAGVEKI